MNTKREITYVLDEQRGSNFKKTFSEVNIAHNAHMSLQVSDSVFHRVTHTKETHTHSHIYMPRKHAHTYTCLDIHTPKITRTYTWETHIYT